MTLQGIHAETIAETLGCSRVSVWRHVHRWNERGIEATRDHRSGSKGSFAEEMLKDIDDAVRNRQASRGSWIQQEPLGYQGLSAVPRRHLRKEVLLRAYPAGAAWARPFVQANQQASYAGEQGSAGGLQKGVAALVDELAQRDGVCLFALDETGIRLESSSFYGAAPKGQRPCVEANGDRKGVNAVGSTEILRQYRAFHSIHPSGEGMKMQQVGQFIDKLMRLDNGKEVWVIWDNHRPHRSIASSYENKYQGRLHFVFLPPYSPGLNPPENIWAWLKDYWARTGAYSTIKELRQRIHKFHIYAYNTPSKVRRRVDARAYFTAA